MSLGRTLNYYLLRLLRLLRWGAGHIPPRQYQILVSIIVGIAAGLVAVLLKWLVHYFRDWFTAGETVAGRWTFVVLPVFGILLTVIFERYVLRIPLQSGLSGLMLAISRKKVNLPVHETYAHVVGSSLTVGFGGSVGLEAPIIRTGSAIGANLARLLGVGRKKQTLLLACGAAAGMAAIFNSPVAGVIFAFEVLVTDIALPSFIPLLIAAATGAVVAKALYSEQIFFLPASDWVLSALPYYMLLGLACGLMAVYVTRTTDWLTLQMEKHIPHLRYRLLLGGLALGTIIFLLPPLFGEGYEVVNGLLRGNTTVLVSNSPFYRPAGDSWGIILIATAVLLLKAPATAITLGSGGVGGKFAPTMFTGALLGFTFVHAINLTGWMQLREANFIAVAMAGLLSGVFKSPLTGIFLIAEITGGYTLFVPLMLVSALAYFVSLYFEPYSAFIRDLAHRGLWVPTHERDLNILKNLRLSELLETNFTIAYPDQTLGDFTQLIARSRRNVFPVTDRDGRFKGIILLDDVRPIMFDQEAYARTTVADLVHQPPAVLQVDESMEKAMEKFEFHNVWNLPVVRGDYYLGFVSKSSVFNHYRQALIDRSREA